MWDAEVEALGRGTQGYSRKPNTLVKRCPISTNKSENSNRQFVQYMNSVVGVSAMDTPVLSEVYLSVALAEKAAKVAARMKRSAQRRTQRGLIMKRKTPINSVV